VLRCWVLVLGAEVPGCWVLRCRVLGAEVPGAGC